MDKEIVHLFCEVLLVCDDPGLIGKEMFATSGCKLSSNASKQWSGTKADFERKVARLEQAINHMLVTHREHDRKLTDERTVSQEEQYVQTLKKRVRKIRS